MKQTYYFFSWSYTIYQFQHKSPLFNIFWMYTIHYIIFSHPLQTMYNLKLRITARSGRIINSHCECASGKGPHGTCKHVAAMTLLLIHFAKEGTVETAKSCTDVLQEHHRPVKIYSGTNSSTERNAVEHFYQNLIYLNPSYS